MQVGIQTLNALVRRTLCLTLKDNKDVRAYKNIRSFAVEIGKFPILIYLFV